MMNRDATPTTVLHFTVICEIDRTQAIPEKVHQRLGDALLWMDGIGHVDVVYDGELEPRRDDA
jgi:hypothetical protein